MGTSSFIGKINPDGTVRGVYCHFDGYLEGVGQTLFKFYSENDKVDALIDLGNLSCVRPMIGVKHNFNDRPSEMTTAYHRDRGEDLKIYSYKSKIYSYKSLDDCIDDGGNFDYMYFFDGECWFYLSSRSRKKNGKWKLTVMSELTFHPESQAITG